MTEPEDTCRPIEIDSETIRVRGGSDMNDESRDALGALIRVAKEKYAAEHPPVEVTAPERRERYAETLYGTLEVSPRRHPWATLSALRRAVWYDRADAAMRLADAELAAAAAVRPPATDRTALREAIAKALRYWVHPTDRGTAAEAVLAALPAADRAAVERARVIAQRLAAHAAGFQDVLDESDRGPWGRMVGADIAALRTALAEPVAVRVRATDQAALRERIAEALYESCATEADVIRLMADAVLAVLPVPADRAAVLRDAEDAVEGLFIEDENPDERSLGFNAALDEVITELRRLAAEPAAAGPDQTDEARPRRGDAVEAWLKRQRDRYDRTDQHEESSEFWHEFDAALDLYRLHADTGTPLGEHVCEARVVGDCECLETAPAVGGAQQPKEADRDRVVAYIPTTRTDLLHCLRCTPNPAGNIWTPLTAEELEDGGMCASCDTDVLIEQQPKEADRG